MPLKVPKKLGLRSAPSGVVVLRFSEFLGAKSQLPPVPDIFGHYGQVLPVDRQYPWGLLGNDDVGDCTCAGAAHAIMLWNAATGIQVRFDTTSCLADYSAITGYKRGDAASDLGADIPQVATYWKNIGFKDSVGVRHLITADLAIDPTRLDHVLFAAAYFGVCGLGLDLPGDAEDQFDAGKPWQLTGRKDSLGLHYVPIVGRNSLRMPLCVTWGRLHAMTPEFLQARLREACVYVSPEYFVKKSGLTPEQFDMAKLMNALEALGG